jgi:hypothetical protein
MNSTKRCITQVSIITGDIMKIPSLRFAYLTFFIGINLFLFLNLNALTIKDLKNDHQNLKTVAITHLLNQKQSEWHKLVTFENDIIDLLNLSNNFKNNPGLPECIRQNLSFTINGHEILPNEKKTILIRKDKPFELSIIAKPSLIAGFKLSVSNLQATMTDHIKFAFAKLLDILSLRFTCKCAFDEKYLHNNSIHYLGNILFEHQEVATFLQDPSLETLSNMVKTERISWSWLDINVNLPQLKLVK